MDLEKELIKIKERNRNVEIEKAWEVSWTRKLLILTITYILTAIVFYMLGIKSYLQNAMIPTIGYFLSTQSMPYFKKIWIKRNGFK